MKIRYVFVAIVLAAAAACGSSPTAAEDARSSRDLPVLRDGSATDSTANSRGGGFAGSGS